MNRQFDRYVSSMDASEAARNVEESHIEELVRHGEKHLGYCFVTFCTAVDAKRAMVLARNSFDIFTNHKNEDRPRVDLLNDDYHMDYDEEFKTDFLNSIVVAREEREQQKKVLAGSMLREEE